MTNTIEIEEQTVFYCPDCVQRDHAFISLCGDEWVYYIEDANRLRQEGPYRFNERAHDSFGLDDVEVCKKQLREYLRVVAEKVGVDFESVEKERALDKITARILVFRVSRLKKSVYEKEDGSEIHLLVRRR